MTPAGWGKGLAGAAALLLLSGLGCERRFFRSDGWVSSTGGPLGNWSSSPDECARGGSVGVGPERVQSVVSLLWEDPRQRGQKYRDHAFERAADIPQRVDVVQDERGGRGLFVAITTLKMQGTQMDGTVCRTLRLDTHEEGRALPEGRPTLAGRLEMDCNADGNHVTADLSFRRCEW